ncbi:ribosomal RNA processing protein 1 [Thraustotheca clavata]|uniref:Ribosomal RNA processing protein 1 n=1 Tax=Thraustotheca clavata TaxID=74557 RepID=A0A1V9YSK9_9STRA|nr:ribosomal RNA processing protein 1 [Thraustotheca clavata]
MEMAAATKFGQHLAHTDKYVRDKAVKKLTLFLVKKKEWTDLDLDKIWKALFYCMWMSDKPKIQQELAENLAKLIHSFPTEELKLRFLHSFFKTIHREWHGIDGLRLDKFYVLIRMMLYQGFKFLEANDWQLTEQFATHLYTEVLSKLPNGLRLHFADIYLTELYKALGQVVETQIMLQLLEPFFKLMTSDADKIVTKRVNDLVFQPLLNDYFFQETYEPNESTEPETDDENEPKVFTEVKLAPIQHRIFDIAAAEETLERNRNLLYSIYSAMYTKTKVDSSKKRDEPVETKKKSKKSKELPKKTEETKADKKAAKVKEVVKESPKNEEKKPKNAIEKKTEVAKKEIAKESPSKNATIDKKAKKVVEKEEPVVEATKKAKKSVEKKEEVEEKKPKKVVEAKPVVENKKAKRAAKEPTEAKSKATPYPRCTSCNGFGKGLIPTGKTKCRHCERTSKAVKKETKKNLKRKSIESSTEAIEEEEESEDTKRVTFGKSKALPYELSMKRMKKSATKDVVKPVTTKGVLKVKEIKAKHDMRSSATLTKSIAVAARAGARNMSSHATEAEALQQMNLWTNVSKAMIAGMAGLTVVTAISHAGGHEHHHEGEHVAYSHNKIRTKPYPWKYSDCNFFDLDCNAKAKAAEQALN